MKTLSKLIIVASILFAASGVYAETHMVMITMLLLARLKADESLRIPNLMKNFLSKKTYPLR